MSCTEESYPQYSKDLVGAIVKRLDLGALSPSQITMTVLTSDVESPSLATTWVAPTFTEQKDVHLVLAMVLIGPGTGFVLAPGRYRVWFKVTANPEESMYPSPVTFQVV